MARAEVLISRRSVLAGMGLGGVSLFLKPVDTLAALSGEKYKTGEVVTHGDPHKPYIYLTLDDWFQTRFIEAAMDIAKKEKVHFTYFPIGKNVAPNKDLVLRAIREGHEVENHSWDHNLMGKGHLPISKDGWEMDAQYQALIKILGENYQQHFFRPPGGDGIGGYDNNPNILTQAQKRDLKVAMWGPDSRGWAFGPIRQDLAAVNYVLGNVLPGLRNGAIVLQHTIGPDISALPTIIHSAKARGLKMITMQEGLQTL